MKWHLKSNFSKMMISYILVLLMPFIITIFAYTKTIEVIKEDALRIRMSYLDSKQDLIDRHMISLDTFAVYLARNEKIENILLLNNLGDCNVSEIADAIEKIPDYSAYNETIRVLLLKYFVFYKDIGVVITKGSAYMTSEWHNDFDLCGIHTSEWFNILFENYNMGIYTPSIHLNIDGIEKPVLLYVFSLPIGNPENIEAVVTLFIDKNRLKEMFLPHSTNSTDIAYIIDKNGDVVLSSVDNDNSIEYISLEELIGRGYFQKDIEGQNMTIMYTKSGYTNWKYIWFIPTNKIMTDISYIKTLIIVSILAVILFGLLVALIMAYIRNKPVKEILKLFFEFKHDPSSQIDEYNSKFDIRPNYNNKAAVVNDEDEYRIIKGSIKSLIDLNRNLEGIIRQQAPIFKTAFIERLLKGEFENEKDIKAFANQVGINIDADGYVVIVFKICESKALITKEILENIYIQRAVIKNFLENTSNGFVKNVDNDKLALLLCLETKELIKNDTKKRKALIKLVRQQVNGLENRIRQKGHFNVLIGVGSVYENLLDIYRSFNEAKYVLFLNNKNSGISFYDSRVFNKDNIMYYPIEDEIRLINMVKAGNKQEVEKLLNMLYEENFIKRCLSQEMGRYLLSEMHGTLIKISCYVSEEISDDFLKIESNKPTSLEHIGIDEAFNTLVNYYLSVCQVFKSSRRDSTYILINNIIEYIETFYVDQNISLTTVADKFQLSESYISHLFKEETGENFSSYLERIRLNNAHRLLAYTEMSMADLARQVGYSSSDTFRKAFKRFHGINPTEYRVLAKAEADIPQTIYVNEFTN